MPDVSLIPKETRIALFMSGFAAALLVRLLPCSCLIRPFLTPTESFPISHYWKNECVDL
jgi:hypothetical protein